MANRLKPKQMVDKPGIINFCKALLIEYRQSLTDKQTLLTNGLLAFIEVWLMVLSFSWGFLALGLSLDSPWTTAAIIMGGSAFAAVALPPSYGAGPAAVSLFVLTAIGINEHVALAFSATYWLISQIPLLIFAGPAVWMYAEKSNPG